MGDLQIHYNKKYKKQLKGNTVVVRVDSLELSRLKELEAKSRRTRSDLIRQSLYDLFEKYAIK